MSSGVAGFEYMYFLFWQTLDGGEHLLRNCALRIKILLNRAQNIWNLFDVETGI